MHPRRSYRMLRSERLERRLGLSRYHTGPLFRGDLDIKEAGLLRMQLRQGVGAPLSPLVSQGDWVEAYQAIAAPPEGALGVPLHSPAGGSVVSVSGEIIEIRPR